MKILIWFLVIFATALITTLLKESEIYFRCDFHNGFVRRYAVACENTVQKWDEGKDRGEDDGKN